MPIRYVPNFNTNTSVEIPDDSITSAKILNGEVKTNDIENNAVTADKLANTLDLSSKTVTLGNTSFSQISSSQISGANVTGSTLNYTQITGTSISGTLATIATITGTNVSGSNAKYTTITGTNITGTTGLIGTLTSSYISASQITGTFSGDGSLLTNIPNAFTVLGFVSNQVVSTTTPQVVGQVLATSVDFSDGFTVNGIANCTDADTDLKIKLYKYSSGTWTQIGSTQTVNAVAPTTFSISETGSIATNTIYELRAYIDDASSVYDDCFISFAYIKAS